MKKMNAYPFNFRNPVGVAHCENVAIPHAVHLWTPPRINNVYKLYNLSFNCWLVSASIFDDCQIVC